MNIYLILPLFLFLFGLIGILISRQNVILMLISLELLLLSIVNYYLIIGWLNFGDFKVVLISILLLTVGASESAIGLGIVISYYKSMKLF
jgi:NADH:ubiquinone oxidoreductase subunit K